MKKSKKAEYWALMNKDRTPILYFSKTAAKNALWNFNEAFRLKIVRSRYFVHHIRLIEVKGRRK